eukprot:9052996-Alexandrium_andersonii.AAC.1
MAAVERHHAAVVELATAALAAATRRLRSQSVHQRASSSDAPHPGCPPRGTSIELLGLVAAWFLLALRILFLLL